MQLPPPVSAVFGPPNATELCGVFQTSILILALQHILTEVEEGEAFTALTLSPFCSVYLYSIPASSGSGLENWARAPTGA